MVRLTTATAKAARPVVVVDNSWREREEARFSAGDYKALPHHFYRYETRDHFAHHSVEVKGNIAFTENGVKGMADRITSMKPGKYLTKFFGDVMTALEITELASKFTNQFGEHLVKFAETPEDIVRIYRDGPYSCMKGWEQVAGFAGDFQVAYLEKDGVITARSVVCPAKQFYVVPYGDAAKIVTELTKLGYHQYRRGEAKGMKIYQDHGEYHPYDFGTFDGGLKKDAAGRTYLEYIA